MKGLVGGLCRWGAWGPDSLWPLPFKSGPGNVVVLASSYLNAANQDMSRPFVQQIAARFARHHELLVRSAHVIASAYVQRESCANKVRFFHSKLISR